MILLQAIPCRASTTDIRCECCDIRRDMGICASSPAPSRQIVVDDAAAARSKEIDRQIKSDEQRQHRIIKLLLLGELVARLSLLFYRRS